MGTLDQPTAPPIDIVFCITELEPGGAERCLVELATRIDRGRFAPAVYCLAPRPSGNAVLAEQLENAGIVLRCFGATRATDGLWLLGNLKKQMKADRPRLVQTFLFHANVLGAWAARRAGVPRVVAGIRVAETRANWHRALSRFADRFVDRQVCVSDSVRDHSIEHGLPGDKLVVIPNAVDAERFANAQPVPPASLGLPDGKRMIVSIGRLDRQKGLDWLLETMPRVFAEMPAHDLVLVGEGPERKHVQALCHRLGIAARVHFAGFRADVPEILAASDLLVLPSRWEGMPNAVLEAMAAGRPVVANEVSGVAQALGPDAGVQMVPPHNPRQFSEHVMAILRDSALAAQLGRANRTRVQREFGYSAMVGAYERLYLALLSGDR